MLVYSFGCLKMTTGAVGVAAIPYLLVEMTPEYLASAESGVTSAEYSPDGSHLLVTYRIRNRSDVYRVSLDGETWTALTNDGFSSSAVYSPDGSQIAFCMGRGPRRAALHVMNVDGSGVRKLTQGRRDVVTPQFSPDGNHIVFSSWDQDGYSDIRLFDLATGQTTQLTRMKSVYDSKPVFVPDGETILFARSTYERPRPKVAKTWKKEIYTVRLDGTNLRVVPHTLGMAVGGRSVDAANSYVVHGDRLLEVNSVVAKRLASHGVSLLAATELPIDLDNIVSYAVSLDARHAIAFKPPTRHGRKTGDSFDCIVYRHDIEAGESHELLRREYAVSNLRYAPDGETAIFIVHGAGPPQTTSHSKHHRELWVSTPTGALRRIDTQFPGSPKWVLKPGRVKT